MTKKHTTGPWSVETDGSIENNNVANVINGADGTMIVYGQVNDADARRIVACVNACEGLDTDKLERVPVPFAQMLNVGFMELWEQYTTLKEQRDELLGALHRIADPKNVHFAGDAQVVARDAICKAGGAA